MKKGLQLDARLHIIRRSSQDDPIVQRSRTLPFHGSNTGSNPVRVTILSL